MKENNLEILLEGIRTQDEKILALVYREYYPYIETFITRNRGTRQDARDVFHDSIVIVYKKANENSLHVHSSLKNYIYGICRFLWLKILEERKNPGGDLIDNEDEYPMAEPDELEDHEKLHLFQYHFTRLGEDCQQVLRLYYDNASLKEIAEIMGYRDEKYAKKKKFKCKERLLQMIKADPRYRK